MSVHRGEEIDKKIIKTLAGQKNPISTLELAKQTQISWHTVRFHCLQLQISGKIDGFCAGRLNLWVIKNE